MSGCSEYRFGYMRGDDTKEADRTAEGCHSSSHDAAAEQCLEVDFAGICSCHMGEIFSKQYYVQPFMAVTGYDAAEHDSASHYA